MTQPGQDVASDLAYVKSLAEEGRDAPLLGGRYYLIWGGLIGLAALFAYLDDVEAISLGAASGYAPWVTAGVIGWILSFTVGRGASAKPGALTLGNKTAFAAWLAVGIFMTIFFITMTIIHDNYTQFGVPPYFLFNFMFPVSFGFYGVAFYATAVAARLSWLKGIAVLSWLFSVVCLFMLGSQHLLLVGAVGSFFCAALPGLLLLRSEPSDIV
ncbi:MAG: hypothetical protein DHS20C05_14650 [Hyphococcus sp.]|nr:MAG: hypothetical protein DHS20C05_14650 [Marinicaulis sp.]